MIFLPGMYQLWCYLKKISKSITVRKIKKKEIDRKKTIIKKPKRWNGWLFAISTFSNIDKWRKCDSILQRNVTIIYRKRHNFLSHHPQVISSPWCSMRHSHSHSKKLQRWVGADICWVWKGNSTSIKVFIFFCET